MMLVARTRSVVRLPPSLLPPTASKRIGLHRYFHGCCYRPTPPTQQQQQQQQNHEKKKGNNNTKTKFPHEDNWPRTFIPQRDRGIYGDQFPAEWYEVDPVIQPHLRCCEPVPGGRPFGSARDTGFHVYFLGTGSGTTSDRLSSCTLVRIRQEGFLFDAGEACQRHIKYSTAKMRRISRIFITHLHADHILGLPGMLLGANIANLFDENTTLRVYGPPGLYNFIVASLSLTYSKLRMKVEVYELTGGKVTRTHWKQRQMLGSLPQFRHECVVRKTIPMSNEEDGVWLIKPYDKITPTTDSLRYANIRIRASEIYHVPNVQTFGYVVEEMKPPPKIDPLRARKVGVCNSKKLNTLKNGFPVMNDDGTRREVQPYEVYATKQHDFKSRKLVLLGDTCGIPQPMRKLCKGADILIHEATMDEIDRPLSIRKGHSTASMAGQFADSIRADLLVLNHHTNKISDWDQSRAREAKDAIDQQHNQKKKKSDRNGNGTTTTTRVLSANDFMEIAIPREGFQFLSQQQQQQEEEEVVVEKDQEEDSTASSSSSGSAATTIESSHQYVEELIVGGDPEQPFYTFLDRPKGNLLPPHEDDDEEEEGIDVDVEIDNNNNNRHAMKDDDDVDVTYVHKDDSWTAVKGGDVPVKQDDDDDNDNLVKIASNFLRKKA